MSEKFALITGGSSGIGLEIAKQLAARKYALLLVSNQDEKLEEFKILLQQQYDVRVEILCLDLSRSESARDVFDYVLLHRFEVEILVNNAGFFFFGEVAEADLTRAQQMIQLHVLTLSLLCTLLGKEMKKRRRGYILNLSSISAFKDFPGIGYYGATKAYIKSFSRSLRAELKYYGIYVTCLCPGPTATDLYDPTIIDVERGKRLGIMMNASEVAQTGVDGLFRDKAVVIPGIVTRLLLILAMLTPYWVIFQIRKRSRWLKEKKFQ